MNDFIIKLGQAAAHSYLEKVAIATPKRINIPSRVLGPTHHHHLSPDQRVALLPHGSPEEHHALRHWDPKSYEVHHTDQGYRVVPTLSTSVSY